MDGKTLEHLKKVLDTYYHQEQKHCKDNGNPPDHVAQNLKALKEWVEENEVNPDVRAYVDKKGIRCLNPECSGKDLHGESVEIEEGEASQEITCPECGRSWIDVYTLSYVR